MVVEYLIQCLVQTVDDMPGLVGNNCHVKSPRMLKAWTVDAGSMDVPNGFNGLNIKFFGGLCLLRCRTLSELAGWRLGNYGVPFYLVRGGLEKSRRSRTFEAHSL